MLMVAFLLCTMTTRPVIHDGGMRDMVGVNVGDGRVAREDDDTFHASKEVDLIHGAKLEKPSEVLTCGGLGRDLVLDVWRHGNLIIPYNVLPAECCQGWLKGFAVHRHFALSGGRQEAEGLGSPLLYLVLPNVDMHCTEFLELYIERGALLYGTVCTSNYCIDCRVKMFCLTVSRPLVTCVDVLKSEHREQ
ncbi:hypothetical protein Efla_003238 [Eimeria flavescens]